MGDVVKNYEVVVSDSDDALAQGIFEQVKAVVDVQFCHEIGLVSFYSLGTNDQQLGYLMSGVAFCQKF